MRRLPEQPADLRAIKRVHALYDKDGHRRVHAHAQLLPVLQKETSDHPQRASWMLLYVTHRRKSHFTIGYSKPKVLKDDMKTKKQ